MFRSFSFAFVTLVAFTSAASASPWSTYVIRNGSTTSSAPQINDVVHQPGNIPAKEFVINEGGMKAGWGSNAVSGLTMGDITLMEIVRHDDSTRFSAGSGPAVAPYVNIWITDGTNYAVIANEPSNPSFAAFRTPGPDGSFTYSFSMTSIAGEPAKVFETSGWNTDSSWVHVATGKTSAQLTFADLASFTIGAPSPAYIAAGNGIGGGAPRELGTNAAYGFNWILGDTLANYVSGDDGYILANPSVVPEPASLALLGLGAATLLVRRRK